LPAHAPFAASGPCRQRRDRGDLLLDAAQAFLGKEDFLTDEEGRRAEGASRD
jgi:hypothetical protein